MSKSNETLKSTLAEILGGYQDEDQRNDIARNLEKYLYHYMLGDPLSQFIHLSDGLKSILTEENRGQIEYELCKEYYNYIVGGNIDYKNIDDAYYRQRISNISSMEEEIQTRELNKLVGSFLQNPRVIQRMCKIIIEKAQKEKGASYLRGIAKQEKGFSAVKALLTGKSLMDRGINPVELDIMGGPAGKPKNIQYTIPEKGLYGKLDIGERNGVPKSAQEDSILLYSHPDEENFRIAVVADGVGGGGNGDVASFIATKMTMEWFKKLPKNFYKKDNILINGKKYNFYELLIEHVASISDEIIKQLGENPRNYIFSSIYKKKKW